MAKITERLRIYNQYILAIAGTIGIIFLLFIAIISASQMIQSWGYDDEDYNQGIISTVETQDLIQDSLRKQIISFNSMILIDSANQIFVLPVGQADLEDGEDYNTGLLNLYSSSKRQSSYYTKSYNNLVLYNNLTSTSEVMFDQRLSISEYFLYSFNERNFIVVTASISDTNEDGVMNQLDFQKLFVYDISNKSLNKIATPENFTTLNVFNPDKSDALLVLFGVDRNQNNFFDRSEEPKIYYKVDINSMTLKEIVDSEKLEQLQTLLEGR